MALRLRYLVRPGVLSDSELVYVVDANNVYFTAITPGTSSINDAEGILLTICRRRRLNWRDCTFYDVQTWRGYNGKRRGYWHCDRLNIEQKGGAPQVENWITVDRWPYPHTCDRAPALDDGTSTFDRHREGLAAAYAPEMAKLPRLPTHIMEVFQPIIDGAAICLVDAQ